MVVIDVHPTKNELFNHFAKQLNSFWVIVSILQLFLT